MSKPETEKKERVIIDYEEEPLLAELELPGLIERYRKAYLRKFAADAAVDAAKAEIDSVVQAVGADTVTFDGWSIAHVVPEAGKTISEEKLRANMMKIGKLDAETIAKIFTKSEVDKKAAAPHPRITAPKGVLPTKSKKDGADENA